MEQPMSEPREFSFGDDSVALSYDNSLVPILFEPWARRLADEFEPWWGRTVLDLATGTGVVARVLADRVGPEGRVIGADINGAMLALAKRRSEGTPNTIEYLESPASPLPLPDAAVDIVVCQQGFQFFPDRTDAAAEVYRVLRPGGTVIATTWRPVAECEYFGMICGALEAAGEPEIASLMRVPHDFLSESDLEASFRLAGFVQPNVTRQEQDMLFPEGVKQGIETAYATPIAPRLRALPEARRRCFEEELSALLRGRSSNGTSTCRMVTNLLTARRDS
jgi:ubiquinone/menaquinone biosynthesis C-methylase UbiE